MITIKDVVYNATISDIKSCSVKGCNNEIDVILELDMSATTVFVPLCDDHAEKIDTEKRERSERSDKGKKRGSYKNDKRRIGDEDIVGVGG